MAKARYQKNLIVLSKSTISVYASPRVSAALETVTEDLTLYQGVRLVELLEAIYSQGAKDGARLAFEVSSSKQKEAEKLVPHRNPGKPRHS